jgi:hypothetical protein
MNFVGFVDSVVRDLRYAVAARTRPLRVSESAEGTWVALVVVLTLGVAIGANTAIFFGRRERLVAAS